MLERYENTESLAEFLQNYLRLNVSLEDVNTLSMEQVEILRIIGIIRLIQERHLSWQDAINLSIEQANILNPLTFRRLITDTNFNFSWQDAISLSHDLLTKAQIPGCIVAGITFDNVKYIAVNDLSDNGNISIYNLELNNGTLVQEYPQEPLITSKRDLTDYLSHRLQEDHVKIREASSLIAQDIITASGQGFFQIIADVPDNRIVEDINILNEDIEELNEPIIEEENRSIDDHATTNENEAINTTSCCIIS